MAGSDSAFDAAAEAREHEEFRRAVLEWRSAGAHESESNSNANNKDNKNSNNNDSSTSSVGVGVRNSVADDDNNNNNGEILRNVEKAMEMMGKDHLRHMQVLERERAKLEQLQEKAAILGGSGEKKKASGHTSPSEDDDISEARLNGMVFLSKTSTSPSN